MTVAARAGGWLLAASLIPIQYLAGAADDCDGDLHLEGNCR